jgi:pimeloyl-ACP methyl ester carboxylesterase
MPEPISILTLRHPDTTIDRMRQIFRYTFYALAIVAIPVVTLPLGFRLAAAWRETTPALSGDAVAMTRLANDTQLAYREWGDRNDPAVILIHGTLAWSQTWEVIAPQIAAAGFRVIAPDMPPFGFSQRPDNADYGRKAQAARILALADDLGLDRYDLIGHSFGGGATIEAAFAAPERVNGLALLDVALGWDDAGGGPPLGLLFSVRPIRTALMAATFTNPMMTGMGLRDFVADDSIITDARIDLYRRPLSVEGTSAAVGDWFVSGLFADEIGSRSADRDRYPGFAPPVMIVWGEDDTVTPLAQGEYLNALFQDATFSILPKVNHIPHVEASDRVAGLIIDFLGSGQRNRLVDPEQACVRR